MIELFTWVVFATFFWPSQYRDFIEVEYELNQLYGDVYEKCDIPLSAITYAFAVKETGNWNWLKQTNKNNLFWLRRWTSKTTVRPKFASYEIKTYTRNGYNVYSNRKDSIYDLMNQFYLRGCKLTKIYVRNHLNWPNWWMVWVDSYYDVIVNISKQYKNNYVSQVDARLMIKPNNIKEYQSTIQKLIDMWFTKSDSLMDYKYTTAGKIIVDTRYMKYRVTKI